MEDNTTLKPFSIYLMDSADFWYVGSAWNKTTPEMRRTKHLGGRGGASKLWEQIQNGVEFNFLVLDTGDALDVHGAYVAEEEWIGKFLASDPRGCLNVNLFPSQRRGWAESPESIEKRAQNNRGRANPKNAERLLGKPRPDLVKAWARPGHKKERGLAISAGMAAMSPEAVAIMRAKQSAAAKNRTDRPKKVTHFRQCGECDMVTNHISLGRHQKASHHKGHSTLYSVVAS